MSAFGVVLSPSLPVPMSFMNGPSEGKREGREAVSHDHHLVAAEQSEQATHHGVGWLAANPTESSRLSYAYCIRREYRQHSSGTFAYILKYGFGGQIFWWKNPTAME